jgi:CubicO group peptidase (beta-lactamase class C family)
MSEATPISGLAPERFAAVKDVFAEHFAQDAEAGARFTVVIEGETVLDLIGGVSDRARTTPVNAQTLFPIFSTGKAVMALLVARLVEQGKLDYEQRVAEIWPAYGQAGKDRVTVGQMMSHQDGLPGFAEPQDPTIWFDRDAVLEILAAQAPMWPPGTASGYHPVTIGFLADELHRRVDGRSMGEAVREDFGAPFGIDYWIGLPESEHPRTADIFKPHAASDLGALDPIKRSAFLDRGSAPGGRGTVAWRQLAIPSANAHATSEALAKLLGIIASGGFLDGKRILSPATIEQATRERIFGLDLVLPFHLSWAAGVIRNRGIGVYGPNETTVGHSGWGGSCVLADPDRRLSAAYVMNKQSPALIGDPRPVKLIEALYRAL